MDAIFSGKFMLGLLVGAALYYAWEKYQASKAS